MSLAANHFVIGLGSNTPDRETRIDMALQMFTATFTDVRASRVYETPANGGDGSRPPYLNAVVVGTTGFTAEALRDLLKSYEKANGRDPLSKEAPGEGTVAIDLDLVMYNGRILRPHDFSQTYFNTGYRELLAAGAFQFALK